MGNEGFFELSLLDVTNRPVSDSGLRVSVLRASDQRVIARFTDLEFPSTHRFALPAFPQERNLYCEITTSRYRQRKSDFFTLTDGETITRNLTVFRRPDKWSARFVTWNQLPNHFLPLQRLLENSPNVRIKSGSSFSKFTADAFDEIDDTKSTLAKASLLNLYTKLSVIKEPTAGNQAWFSFVKQIVEFGRERFIAIVDSRMGQIVHTIKDGVDKFKDYKNTPAENHHGNIPAGYTVTKSKMFSIKSREENGNVQLTMAPAKDSEGNEVLLLDSDIDENGALLAHLADIFKHKFSGGTHPFSIYEYLALAHRDRPLGYELV